jgi:hypothetical protein
MKINLPFTNISPLKLFLFVIVFMKLDDPKAQSIDTSKILGCWEIEKMEFLEKAENQTEIEGSSKGFVTCFEKEGNFTTKIKTAGPIIGSGTYHFVEGGKFIVQESGNTGESKGEIIRLDKEQFILKTPAGNILLHFKRTY